MRPQRRVHECGLTTCASDDLDPGDPRRPGGGPPMRFAARALSESGRGKGVHRRTDAMAASASLLSSSLNRCQ